MRECTEFGNSSIRIRNTRPGFITIGLLLWLASGSAIAATPIQIDLDGILIIDNGTGDLDPATDIIRFNEPNIVIPGSGGFGAYRASGTLKMGGGGAQSSTLTLTDLDIEATGLTGVTNQVPGSIVFSHNLGTSLPLPVSGSGSLDGNWTLGNVSNAPATVTDGSISFNAGTLFTGTVLNGSTIFSFVDEPLQYLDPQGGLNSLSSDGNIFGPLSYSGNNVFAVGDTIYLDWKILSGSATGLSGDLGFSLINVGDGFYLPGSATVGISSVVPLPAAGWLFGSGLIGLAGMARRRKA